MQCERDSQFGMNSEGPNRAKEKHTSIETRQASAAGSIARQIGEAPKSSKSQQLFGPWC